MTTEFQNKVDQALQRYLVLPDTERTSFLEQLRSWAPEIATEVERRVNESSEGSQAETDESSSPVQSEVQTVDFEPNEWSQAPSTKTISKSTLPGFVPPKAGRFQNLELIAEGGMGAVLRSYDPEMDRMLAVKIMRPKVAANPKLRALFLRETRITGQLQHPGVPPIHDLGQLEDGLPYFGMKLIEGKTLAEELKKRQDPSQDMPRFLGIFEQICQTLGFAHRRGVIHRDLKPANIMVGEFGEVQVMDWGLAKFVNDTEPTGGGDAPKMEQISSTSLEHSQPTGNETIDHKPQPQPDDPLELRHSLSTPGDVMGTLLFMAPEQGRGENKNLDERCDVFGLGAIMCVILTGDPPFYAKDPNAAMRQVKEGDLAEAWSRLEQCGADNDIVDLCRACLSPNKVDRPRDGSEVAERVTKYLESVQERLKQTEIQKREAQVKTLEERKRRRVSLALTLVGALFLSAIVGASVWYRSDRLRLKAEKLAERARMEAEEDYKLKKFVDGFTNAMDEARTARKKLHDRLVKPQGVRQLSNAMADWEAMIQVARSALERAEVFRERAEDKISPNLAQKFQELRAGVKTDEKERGIVLALNLIRDRSLSFPVVNGQLSFAACLRDYPIAFARAGLDFTEQDTATLAQEIKNSRIREPLLAALDHWTASALAERAGRLFTRLSVIAITSDADQERRKFRNLILRGKSKRLVEIARGYLSDHEAMAKLLPHTHCLVGQLLLDSKLREAWYRAACSMYPDDVELADLLGAELRKAKKDLESEGCYKQILAVQPTNYHAWNNWGVALEAQKKGSAAIEKYKKAITIEPTFDLAYTNWGVVLTRMQKYNDAIEKFQKASALDSKSALAYANWGTALYQLNKYEAAIDKFKKACTLDSKLTFAYTNWGGVLVELHQYEAAIDKFKKASDKFKKASERDSIDAGTYYNWGNALAGLKNYEQAVEKYKQAILVRPEYASAYANWGTAMKALKKYSEAIEKYKKAIALRPNDAVAHYNYGTVLSILKKHNEALDRFQKAIAVDPRYAKAHIYCGITLCDLNKYEAAIDTFKKAIALNSNNAFAYRYWGYALVELHQYEAAIDKFKKAIALDSNDAFAYNNWGDALVGLRKLKAAIIPLQKAIDLQPQFPNPRVLLGEAHFQQGKFKEAMTSFRSVTNLLPPGHPKQKVIEGRIRECQFWLNVEQKLPNVLANKLQVPGSEHYALIILCSRYRKRYRDAVQLYNQMFQRQPKWATHLGNQHRYNAACFAVLAAAGKGLRSDKLEPKDRAALLEQADYWLRADLKAYQKLWRQSGPNTFVTQDRLNHWLKDSDLSSVRTEQAISKLPTSEQAAWRKLWADVKSLQKTIRASYTEKMNKGQLNSKSPQAVNCHYQDHKIQLKAGRRYTIELRGQKFNSFLIVLDPSGKRRLGQNDDIVPKMNLNSRVSLRMSKTGTYVVRVTTAQPRQVGTYTLHVFDHGPVK